MRIVIDTNCLIASIPPNGPFYWLYQAFRAKRFTWVVSTEILDEYVEKLSEFYSVQTAELVCDILISASNVEMAAPYYRWNLIDDDPDDNKFSDLALSVNAHYLVSNDRHFNVFKTIEFPHLDVVRLDEFKLLLAQ